MTDPFTISVGGVPFVATTMQSAVATVLDAVETDQAMEVRLANAYCVALANSDETYGRLLQDRGTNYPDGTPVALMMRVRGPQIPSERVRGPSFFVNLLRASENRNVRHFFLGTDSQSLEALIQNARSQFPSILIAGHFAPPFTPNIFELVSSSVASIQASDANIVWVALGTPKQDIVASHITDALQITTVGVGAAFSFFAGITPEAPKWVQSIGAEWLYRLASEPRRLWRRYLIGNAQFLAAVVKKW